MSKFATQRILQTVQQQRLENQIKRAYQLGVAKYATHILGLPPQHVNLMVKRASANLVRYANTSYQRRRKLASALVTLLCR